MDSLNFESPLANIYDRQTGIKDYKESSAIVIGVGGIGSWIALDLALLGVGTLVIIDPDKLESSNLNRTLFKLNQIGSYKTIAIKDLIAERRPDTIIITVEDHFQTPILNKYEVDYIFDATDNLASRQMIKELGENFSTSYCKVGYDGFQATLSLNEFNSGRWGEDGSYTIVLSFFGTPQLLSAMAVIEMLIVDEDKSKTVNFNVKKLLNKINQQE